VEVRVVLIDIARQETQFKPVRFTTALGRDNNEKIRFETAGIDFVGRVLEWFRGRLAELRLRRTIGGLSNPRPSFGVQLVTNLTPTDGQMRAEIHRSQRQSGRELVGGLLAVFARDPSFRSHRGLA
jgi:hypothetical protein